MLNAAIVQSHWRRTRFPARRRAARAGAALFVAGATDTVKAGIAKAAAAIDGGAARDVLTAYRRRTAGATA
jgi:anthranilate phosphoribosyltransferase